MITQTPTPKPKSDGNAAAVPVEVHCAMDVKVLYYGAQILTNMMPSCLHGIGFRV